MKRNHLAVRKAVLAAVCLACALSSSACGNRKETNENKDPLTGEDQSQQTEESSTTESSANTEAENGYREFDTMLGDENTDPKDIIGYINTNIVSAGVNDVERFFKGLLSFGSDIRNIDFTELEDSRQYMPEDMIAFMDLMKLESDTPSMVMSDKENRKVINMTLSEMLERAVLFEHHLQKYPNNASTEAASRLYEEIATQAISGGYNSAEGIPHFYKGEQDNTITQESLQYYQQFAQANKDSNLGRIVEDYITVLQNNQFQINDNMEEFYRGLHARLNVNQLGNTSGTGTTNEGSTSNGSNVEDNSETNNTETATDTDNNANTASNTNADTVIQGTVSR